MPDMPHKGHTADFSAAEKEEKENEAREGGGEERESVIATILRNGVSWASPAGTSSASQPAERGSIVPSLGFCVTVSSTFASTGGAQRPTRSLLLL